ncbi:MAG: hypothetical protein WCI74_11740, partial [Actinomycetes bacterium]
MTDYADGRIDINSRAPASDLVATPESKLCAPKPQVAVVRRQRLLDRMAAARYQIVAIQGPGGFGKSTLAAQFAQESVVSAWATLDATDSDPVVLVSTLLNSLAKACALPGPESGKLWPGGLSGDEPTFSRWVLPQFRRAVESSSPATIIIDEVNLAEGQQARQVLMSLVGSLPAGSSVILVGRSMDGLPLPLWCGQGRLLELTSSDLLLDREEIAEALAGFRGGPASTALIDTVEQDTAGWPVAVYLESAHDESQSRQPPADLRRYLRSEILANTDPDLVEFLRITAPLEVLSVEACAAVTDSGTVVADLLGRAASESLLISRIEGRRNWFRLHKLLRDQLLDDLLLNEPAVAARVNARAALWYRGQGLVDRAIAHAIGSGDPELLGQVLWEPASEALLRGQSGRVRRWLSRTDDAVVAKSAGLSMAATWAAVSAGDYPNAARWEHVTVGLIESGQVHHQQTATVEPSFRLLAALAGRNGWRYSAQIAAESGEAMPADSLMRVFADLLQGWLLVLAGDREPGLILLDRVRAVARVHDMATTATEAGSLCALMHCIRGDKARAAELAAQARATWEPRDREGALMTKALLSLATACVGDSADSAGSDHAPIRLSLD